MQRFLNIGCTCAKLTFGLFLFDVVGAVTITNDIIEMAAKRIIHTAFCPFSCNLM
jgi:hypothetical protein